MARKKGPQAQQAYDYLKKKIQEFELPPGATVSDCALEGELNMSRSPIREAIMRLAAEGLIEFTDKGTQVTNITLHDIVEICQVRKAIESASVDIIMKNGGLSQAEKAQLTECFESLMDSSEPMKNYYYDDQFHDLIMTMSKNKRLIDISNQMRVQICRARWLNCILPERIKESEQEHTAIYRALMENDREKSIQAVIAHLEQSEENFRRIFAHTNFGSRTIAAISFVIGSSNEN